MRRLARHAAACLSLLCLSCAGVELSTPLTALPKLWIAPEPPDDPAYLSLEPRVSVARLGEPATLTLHGHDAEAAECSVARQGFSIEVQSPERTGVVNVECVTAGYAAFAQVTFTDSAEHPAVDPYGGGIVLFKLREPPRVPPDVVGRRDFGSASLERLLHGLGAWAMAAFPVDLTGSLDYVGLRRWLAIDLPKRANFYQAVELLRADESLEPDSYLPEDSAFLRVGARKRWPRRLEVSKRRDESLPVVEEYSLRSARPPWPVRAVGAPDAWDALRGRGIGIAIVDTGVDRRHRALVGNMSPEAAGANFAHLAVAHAYGPPGLAAGLLEDVSDWSGAAQGRTPRSWGHGTPIAALAAGFNTRGGHVGVAPQAWLLPVDVQENLRVHGGRDDDPRMRDLPKGRRRHDALAPLREPVWARALGTVYATTKGARVITCAWPAQPPHQILYDALRFAEDNCALPVCAVEESAQGVREKASYPASWRSSGAIFDVWSGQVVPDRLHRPLESMIVAGSSDAGPVADLRAPKPGRGGKRTWTLPASQPEIALDRTHAREAEFAGPGLTAGLIAGTAALVLEKRPDLAPTALREVLLAGAGPDRTISVPGALRALEGQRIGECPRQERPGLEAGEESDPWLKRTKYRGSLKGPMGDELPVPGSAAPEEDDSDESDE